MANTQFGGTRDEGLAGHRGRLLHRRGELSDVTPADLGLGDDKYISVRIEVPVDAANVGGVDLFGAGFGNHPKDLALRIQCRAKPDRNP